MKAALEFAEPGPATPVFRVDWERPRKRILEALALEPGLTRAGLGRRIGMPNGTLDHHLAVLLQAGLVTRAKCAKEALWGPASYAPQDLRKRAILQRPVAIQIRMFLRTVRQGTIPELVDHLRVSRKIVSRELDLMIAVGLLESLGRGHRRYRLAVQAGPNMVAAASEKPSSLATTTMVYGL